MPNVIMLNVIMLNVVMLNVVMLNVVMLNVVMLNVVMLSVVAPHLREEIFFCNIATCCQCYKHFTAVIYGCNLRL